MTSTRPSPRATDAKSGGKGAPTPKRPAKTSAARIQRGVVNGANSAETAETRSDSRRGAQGLQGALDTVRWVFRAGGQWIAALIGAMVHLTSVQYASAFGVVAEIPAYLLPAVITLYMRPASRRHWYRFAAPLCLTYPVYIEWKLAWYVLVTAWVLRRCWAIERDPERDLTVRTAIAKLWRGAHGRASANRITRSQARATRTTRAALRAKAAGSSASKSGPPRAGKAAR